MPNTFPEISKALEHQILSLVVTDLKTRRQTRLKKDSSLQLAFHANISADAVLQHGMSCCQRRSRPQKLQGAISWQNSSSFSRNIWAPEESGSQFVMSRHSLEAKSWLHSSAPTATLRMCRNCSSLPGQWMMTMYSGFVWLGKASKPSQIPHTQPGKTNDDGRGQAAALLELPANRPPRQNLHPEKHPNHWHHKRKATEGSRDRGVKPSSGTWRPSEFRTIVDTESVSLNDSKRQMCSLAWWTSRTSVSKLLQCKSLTSLARRTV